MSLLAVVIPCFNRHEMVAACISSILGAARSCDVEVVLVDDGSDPPLGEVLSSTLRERDVVITQTNRGRASALRHGLLACSSEFVMIMDSDDEMIEGAIDRILADIDELKADFVGLVYETVEYDTGRSISTLPHVPSATLLELRADFRVKGDLKEVVRVDVVRSSLYSDPSPERRVPTSYIWAGVSSAGKVRVIPHAVVRHRYLPGGMTRSIATLKRNNPNWLARTYYKTATAAPTAYKSRWFRLQNSAKALSVAGNPLLSEEVGKMARMLGPLGFFIAYCLGLIIRCRDQWVRIKT